MEKRVGAARCFFLGCVSMTRASSSPVVFLPAFVFDFAFLVVAAVFAMLSWTLSSSAVSPGASWLLSLVA